MSSHDLPWSFLHVNDSHMGTPRSYRYRPAINERWAAIKQQLAAEDAALLLHGGDLTRDGDTHEYEYAQARADLDALPFPSFVIPGNMDVGNKFTDRRGEKPGWRERGLDWDDRRLNITGERLDLFGAYFGPCHWTFRCRDVRFTGLFAALGGTGLPHEQRMWEMLERLPSLPPASHHVAVMHYWPFIEELDEPSWDIGVEEQWNNWYFSIDQPHRGRLWELLRAARVEVLFCGHVHTGRPVQEVDGIRLYRTSAAGNTPQLAERWPEAERRFGYHRCTVSADGIDVSFVPGPVQAEEHDAYGPMGHPLVAERDYSVAREQPPLQPDPGVSTR